MDRCAGGPVKRVAALIAAVALLCGGLQPAAASWPTVREGDVVIPSFAFADGETLRDLRLHYRTLGTPHRDARGHVDNAVLVLHGTGGTGAQFLRDEFAGRLFNAGQPLDASRYYLVLPDCIGHGASSKPSDGLHARFPTYGYRDMVRGQHELLARLGVDHLRLVMGTSMGGMQTWLWGETYPAEVDALMPLASLPTAIAGRNRVWRDMIVDAIRSDPAYAGGDYTKEPEQGMRAAEDILWIAGSAPLYDQTLMPTAADSDRYYAERIRPAAARYDANDEIYQFESSRDYDPEPRLGTIHAPLVAVNSADDFINPPELGIMERLIGRVPHGRFVLEPISPATRGHGTHTLAAIWERELVALLAASSTTAQR